MTPADVERVFGTSRLQIGTGHHVEVFREVARSGEERRYTKRFLETPGLDLSPWTEREWRVLGRLGRLPGAPVAKALDLLPADENGPARLQTRDAGATLDQWATLVPLRRGETTLRNVFEDCANWWQLARQCMVALDALHALGFVHLELKADNVCIPWAPAGAGRPLAGQPLAPRIKALTLIDVAFSLVPEVDLPGPLPLLKQPAYEYQSPRLLHALETGRRGSLEATRALDWRCDFFSLAAMLWRFLPEDDDAPGFGWSGERHDQAKEFVQQLLDVHGAPLPTQWPHRQLIALAALRLREPDLQAALRAGCTFDPERALALDTGLTPPTRIAETMARKPAPETPHADAPVASAPMPLGDAPAEPRTSPPVPLNGGMGREPSLAPAPLARSGSEAGAFAPAPLGDGRREPTASASAPLDNGRRERTVSAPVPLGEGRRTPSTSAPAPLADAAHEPPGRPLDTAPMVWPEPAADASAAAAGISARAAMAPIVRRRRRRALGAAIAALVVIGAAVAAWWFTIAQPSLGLSASIPAPGAAPALPSPAEGVHPDTAAAPVVAAATPPASSTPAVTDLATTVEPSAAATSASASASMATSTSTATAPPTAPPSPASAAATPAAAPAPIDVTATAAAPPPPPPEPALGPAPAEREPAPGGDLDAVAAELLRNRIPRVAQAAERQLARVLAVASGASEFRRRGNVRVAIQALRSAAPRPAFEAPVRVDEARRLNEAALGAYWRRDDVDQAVRLQTRAFGANPFDSEVVGNLAFLRLKENPPQAEAARQLALHSLTLNDPRFPSGRIEDWTALAVASALTGHEADARNAWFASMALASDLQHQCNNAVRAEAIYGGRLRPSVQAMLQRARSSAAYGRCEAAVVPRASRARPAGAAAAKAPAGAARAAATAAAKAQGNASRRKRRIIP